MKFFFFLPSSDNIPTPLLVLDQNLEEPSAVLDLPKQLIKIKSFVGAKQAPPP
jgi:hypothetical protein